MNTIFSLILLVSILVATNNKFSEGNNEFSTNLSGLLIKENGNLIISPLSVGMVLSIVHQGSAGTTYEAFTKVLRTPEASSSAEESDSMLKKLEALKQVKFNIANKIILGENTTLIPDFKDIVSKKFHLEAESMDFSNIEELSKKINDDILNKTNNKIEDFVSPSVLNSEVKFFLLSAVYFSGSWAKQFEAQNTKKEDFYLLNGTETKVDMMHQYAKFQYAKNDDLNAKILKLPYLDNEVSMYIVLPKDRKGIVELENKINELNFRQLSETMNDTDIDLFLPKYKIISALRLNDYLTEIGLGETFSDKANLTRITDTPLKVGTVLHKAFIEVNETGTEADAVTLFETHTNTIPKKPRITTVFRAEHPFIFAIVDNDSYDLLLFGRVANPVY